MGRGRKSRRHRNKIDFVKESQSLLPTVFPTAIYVRLSVENLGRKDNGATIENQKDICREYIKKCSDLQLVRIYEDNGWTGTIMQRPAFEELMEDVKKGVIKAIVVRDLSRFARNYIEAGTYLESVFPHLGVRFLGNPAYIGVRILGREHSAIYKGVHREKTTPEHWHIFPDAHEALVTKEIFEAVQIMLNEGAKKRRDSLKRTAKSRAKLKDLFEGKIFCADCGYRMYYSRHQFRNRSKGWFGRYVCSSYVVYRKGTNCNSHYITQKGLEEKVLAIIQTHIKIGIDYEKLIAGFQGSDNDREKRHNFDMAIRRASQKLGVAQRKRSRLYEDYVAGILDEEEYLFAKKSYENDVEKWNNEFEKCGGNRVCDHRPMKEGTP